MELAWQGWFTLGVLLLTLGGLAFTRYAPDLILVGALTLLIVSGVLTPSEALAGLANPGLATVGVLFAVVAGLIDTGSVQQLGRIVFGRTASLHVAKVRMMAPVIAMSAFLNNTPVVAMMVPAIEDWCRRQRISVSKFMLPLSYAAIFGGTCTLVGTSTNLIVHGLVLERTDLGPIGFFELAWVGLPFSLVATAFVVLAGPRLIPERKPPLDTPSDPREYVAELAVQPQSPLIGQTIEQAGLRNLPGAFVAEIERGDTVLPAVAPTEKLQSGDVLVFVGMVDSVADLVKLKGLAPVAHQLFKLDQPRPERRLIEAVISVNCPLVGQTIREGRFRARYGAVVIAAARAGERIRRKIGDIVLRPGDTLMLEAPPSFLEQQRNSRDFLLVSELQGWTAPRHERSRYAVSILAAMVLLTATSLLSMLEAALLAAGLMIATRCTTGSSARSSVDWSVLTIIGASLGLGAAMETTGAAQAIADSWLSIGGRDPMLALAVVFVLTSLFTCFITNNAAAVLVFPVAQATAASLGVSLWPFVVTIMMGASASFATPIGYQTNLMVYGPGGYRFGDYLRLGVPLVLLLGAMTLLIVPRVWPLVP